MGTLNASAGTDLPTQAGADGGLDLRPPVWAILGIVLSLALAVPYYASVDGLLDFAKHAVGRDFVNLWTAGALIGQGRPVDIFDPQTFGAAQRALMGADFPLHFWSYPPTTLFFAAPFAGIPYLAAYAIWTALTLAALVAAARALFKNWCAVLVLVVAPSTVVNLMLGQNGYLTCALMIGGFAILHRRPVLAGVLFGLLTFKPHLGIMIPIALIALGKWRTILAAAATGVAFAAGSVAVFGWETWIAFLDLTMPYQLAFMADGTGPFTWMMPTLYMSGRLLGLPSDVAYALQLILGAAVAVIVFVAFRRGGDWRLLSALAFTAPIVASPQAFNYDMGLISVAVLLLAIPAGTDGFGRLERLAVAFAWCLPILVMVLNAAGLPVAPLALAALMAVPILRLRRQWTPSSPAVDALAQRRP